MLEYAEDDLLTTEEFELLDEKDQEDYLALLHKSETAWTLTGKQVVADNLANEVKELLYGGAAGGGKSEWILHRAWRLSRAIPGHRTLILRTSFQELRRTLIARSIMLYGQHTPVAEMPRYRVADKEWHFPNGSIIEFGYCETVEDAAQYQGAEYDMICFDEQTQFTAEQYDFIRTRARTTVSKKRKGARPHIIGATNPGDKGHEYCKGTFVDSTDYGELGAVKIIKDDEDRWHRATEEQLENVDPRRMRHVAFVPSTVADNPHVDPEYVANLMTMPEKLQRRMLYGDWDLPEGMYFEDFKRSIADDKGELVPYHVIPAFPIPDGWYKVRALDWGYSAPYCCLWLAWDPDGRCYVYREAYANRLTTREQAEQVVGMTQADEKINATVADPSCWAKRDTLTIADQWKEAGLRCTKAKNDRIAGWMRVREYLKPMEDGWPALQVFDNCQNLVRTMPNQLHDKINPEDLDTKLEDHAVDALRYGLMLRPRHSKPKESPLDWAEKRFLAAIGKNKKKNKEFLV